MYTTLKEARAVAKSRNQEDGISRWTTLKIGRGQYRVMLKTEKRAMTPWGEDSTPRSERKALRAATRRFLRENK